jgi:hypothetical protein
MYLVWRFTLGEFSCLLVIIIFCFISVDSCFNKPSFTLTEETANWLCVLTSEMDWKKKVCGCQCWYGGTKCSISQTIHGRICRILDSRNVQLLERSAEFYFVLDTSRWRLRGHTPVNLTLRCDIKVTNVCGKDACACCRSPMSRSLNGFDKSGPILKVALLPYHRASGASWNPDFYNGVGLDVLAYQSPDSFKRVPPSAYLWSPRLSLT